MDTNDAEHEQPAAVAGSDSGSGDDSSGGEDGNNSNSGDSSGTSGEFEPPPAQRRRLRSDSANDAPQKRHVSKHGHSKGANSRDRSTVNEKQGAGKRSRHGGARGRRAAKDIDAWMAEEAQQLLDMEERLAQVCEGVSCPCGTCACAACARQLSQSCGCVCVVCFVCM